MKKARSNAKEAKIQATVIGPCKFCGAGAEWWGAVTGCDHSPTFTRELGVISYWHRNPLKRLAWRLTRRNRLIGY